MPVRMAVDNAGQPSLPAIEIVHGCLTSQPVGTRHRLRAVRDEREDPLHNRVTVTISELLAQ